MSSRSQKSNVLIPVIVSLQGHPASAHPQLPWRSGRVTEGVIRPEIIDPTFMSPWILLIILSVSHRGKLLLFSQPSVSTRPLRISKYHIIT